MKTLFYIYIFLPFLTGLGTFLGKNASDSFNRSKYFTIGLILVVYSIYFSFMLSLSGQDHLSLGQELMGYLDLAFELKVDSLNSLLICVNTAILFLIILFIIGKKDNKNDIFDMFICSFFAALANTAMMAASLYTFFIFGELLFLLAYIYHCRISKNKTLVVMRYSGLAASLIFILVMLYLREKNILLDSLEMDLQNSQEQGGSRPLSLVLWGMILYFLIKLFLFPVALGKKDSSASPNIISDFLIPQMGFVLFLYSLKKYVIEVFPQVLKDHSFSLMLLCAAGYIVFNVSAFRSKSILRQQLLIRKGITLLILGAFLGFSESANIGGFVLLVTQSFTLLALYVLSSNDLFQSQKKMRNGIVLLAAILCALNFFPLTGNFIGLYKIVVGHSQSHLSLLILIIVGLLFSFGISIRWFLFFTDDRHVKNHDLVNNKNVVPIVLVCLIVVMVLGIHITALDRFII